MLCPKCKQAMHESAKRGLFVCVNPDCGETLPLGLCATEDDVRAVERMPSIVAIPVREWLNETHPIMRLHRFCDAAEILTRFLTLVAWMDTVEASAGKVPDRVLRIVRDAIPRPTFGAWAMMLRALAEHSEAPDQLVVPEVRAFALQNLLPRLGSGSGKDHEETAIIALRNVLAHGGAMTHDVARRLLQHHEAPAVEVWKGAVFLADIQVGLPREGRILALRGLAKLPALENVPEIVSEWLKGQDAPERIVLVRGGRGMRLWPVVDFDAPRQTAAVRTASASESTPLVYLRSESDEVIYTSLWGHLPLSHSADAVTQFRKLFHLADQRQAEHRGLLEDFTLEVRSQADQFVGRTEELLKLKSALANAQDGLFWVWGPPGSGKSMLMAKFASNLSNMPAKQGLAVAYCFRAGDPRCSTGAFLRFVTRKLNAWRDSLGPTSPHDVLADLGADVEALRGAFLKELRAVQSVEVGANARRRPRVILVIDGLDEIARYDPEFPRFVTQCRYPGVVWVCAGRGEPVVTEAFNNETIHHVFPDGLPGMCVDDVRALLINGTDKLKYGLLRLDEEHGTSVSNPFVVEVLRRAAGLPLYVRFVVEDIVSGTLSFSDAERLPHGLDQYYDELLRRTGIGDLQASVTATVTLLAWAEVALTELALIELLAWRHVLTNDDEGKALLRRTLGHAALMLRRAPSLGGTTGFAPYHDSLRAYLRENSTLANTSKSTRLDLAEAALHLESFSVNGDARRYLVRYGVAHLVAAHRFGDAVNVVHGFLSQLDDQRPLGMHDLRAIAKQLIVSLKDCMGGECSTIDSSRLLAILMRLGDRSYAALLDGFRVLRAGHPDTWADCLSQIVRAQHWQGMYASAMVMAEAYVQRRDGAALATALSMANSSNSWERELGLSALKGIVPVVERGQQEPLLKAFLNSDSFVNRAVLGETLLTVAMLGGEVRWFVESNGLAKAWWPYQRLLYADAIAVESLLAKRNLSGDAGMPETGPAYEDLAKTEKVRQALLACGSVANDAKLLSVLQGYYRLPVDRTPVLGTVGSLGNHPKEIAALVTVLLGHPSWEVREVVAVVMAKLRDSVDEINRAVCQAVASANWRVRYGVLNYAYLSRWSDNGELLEGAVRKLSFDPVAFVRGQAAMALKEWLAEAPLATRDSLAESFVDVIGRLLGDEDLWPIEEAVLTVAALQGCGASLKIGPPQGCLLEMVPGWLGMETDDLRNSLNDAKKSLGPRQ